MTGWAATSTLREALVSKALEYNPRGPALLTEEAAALALVETALDAAAAISPKLLDASHGRNLMISKEELDALAAALRAVREGT